MINKLCPVFINGKKATVFLKKHYNKQVLLISSTIRKYQNINELISKAPVLQVSYKTIHVASSQVKKIKAQQQWLLRNVNDYSYFNL